MTPKALEEAREIVEKVNAALGTHGRPWVEKNWLKKGTPEYAKQAKKLGRAHSIVTAAARDPLIEG